MPLFERIKKPLSEPPEAAYPPERAHPIGGLLRQRRIELALDLESVGAALCIKPLYLAALEDGRAQDLPGPTYALGFMRAYANYLGFDAERVLDGYKAESAEIHTRPDLTLPMPLGERSLPGGPILLVALILALCGYGTWYYLSTAERSRPERVAAVPAELRRAAAAAAPTLALHEAQSPTAADAPAASAAHPGPLTSAGGAQLTTGIATTAVSSAAPDAAATGREATGNSSAAGRTQALSPDSFTAAPRPEPAAPAAAAGSSAVAKSDGQIDIRALADCWIQVRTADQTIVFSKILKTGEIYRVPRAGLFLRTGNAGALAIAVDGKNAPPIGAVGALRRNVALDPAALLAGTAVRG